MEFSPQQAGEHQIYLSFASEPIPGSPFACKVYDVEAIKVRECQKGIVGKPVTFLVETSRAGPGNLEVTGEIEDHRISPGESNPEEEFSREWNFPGDGIFPGISMKRNFPGVELSRGGTFPFFYLSQMSYQIPKN